jgi:hypothetical protein
MRQLTAAMNLAGAGSVLGRSFGLGTSLAVLTELLGSLPLGQLFSVALAVKLHLTTPLTVKPIDVGH